MIRNFLFVGFGGCIGSMLRYGVGAFFSHTLPQTKWPIGTILVNLLGCFVIGLVGGLAGNKFDLNTAARVFIITGILGGFTTFSAFGIESFTLIHNNQYSLFVGNVLVQVVGGILLCSLGIKLATLV